MASADRIDDAGEMLCVDRYGFPVGRHDALVLTPRDLRLLVRLVGKLAQQDTQRAALLNRQIDDALGCGKAQDRVTNVPAGAAAELSATWYRVHGRTVSGWSQTTSASQSGQTWAKSWAPQQQNSPKVSLCAPQVQQRSHIGATEARNPHVS